MRSIDAPGFSGARSNRAGQESGRGGLYLEHDSPCCVYSRARIAILLQSCLFTYARIDFLFGWIQIRPFDTRRNARDEGLGRAGINRAHGASCLETTYPLGLFPPSVPGHRVAYREGLRAMSIDTLLEAARYLEWQAQQQQITRGKTNGKLLQGAGTCSTVKRIMK